MNVLNLGRNRTAGQRAISDSDFMRFASHAGDSHAAASLLRAARMDPCRHLPDRGRGVRLVVRSLPTAARDGCLGTPIALERQPRGTLPGPSTSLVRSLAVRRSAAGFTLIELMIV